VLKWYADEHVHARIVQALRARGMDVVTVQDQGRERAKDRELLSEALANERVMLTNDADFLAIAAELSKRQVALAPIFYWPQRGRRIGEVPRSILREARSWDYAAACSRVFFV